MEYTEGMISRNSAASGTPQNDTSVYDAALPKFSSVDDVIHHMRPDAPVQCMHPDRLADAAKLFLDHFPGHSLYAVKSNPDVYVLRHLYAAGIRHFDVASLAEIKLIHDLFPDAHMAYLNPVKSRASIRAAYYEYGVRDFVVDCCDELHKVIDETDGASDLLIIVRIAMPKGSAAYALTTKFGCTPEMGTALLQEAATHAKKVGVSFHVGSQTTDPASYAVAIQKAGDVVKASGIAPSVFDIGGGFPVAHLGMDVPPLTAFFDVIRTELAKLDLPATCEIWSEPGRGLSGTCSTILARVELRKGDVLYINDGSYGNLFEIATGGWKNTVRAIHPTVRKGRKPVEKPLMSFRFYGPTCDSVDYMPGPFMLPMDVAEGDWIAIESAGSYTNASHTNFNGFGSDSQVEIIVSPVASKRRNKTRAEFLTVVK